MHFTCSLHLTDTHERSLNNSKGMHTKLQLTNLKGTHEHKLMSFKGMHELKLTNSKGVHELEKACAGGKC